MQKRKTWRVLVFPGGVEIGLEIGKSLRYCKEILLYSASSDVKNHGPYFYEKHFIIPPVNQSGWFNVLLKIVKENAIDIIYPANDFVIDALISNHDKIPAILILPSKETVEIIRSKSETYQYFKNILPVPRIYNIKDRVSTFPVFQKPDNGYGAQGTRVIHNSEELRICAKKNMLIMEYLPGREYTVDCFSSVKSLLFCSARERTRIRMGTSMNALPAQKGIQTIAKNYAEIIQKKLNMRGAWFFQIKGDKDGTLKLMEIEPRIAGTMALNRVRGINFPLLSVFDKMDIPVAIMLNNCNVELDRALKNRYKHDIDYNTVYIDWDDTIVCKGKLNLQVVTFLFQCVNEQKKIILLTKSLSTDLNSVINKYRLNGLFDEIIQIEETKDKSDLITVSDAIFIDDSFSQRRDVFFKKNIPVFAPSMVEMLIKDKAL